MDVEVKEDLARRSAVSNLDRVLELRNSTCSIFLFSDVRFEDDHT